MTIYAAPQPLLPSFIFIAGSRSKIIFAHPFLGLSKDIFISAMAPPASAEELAYMEAHINQTLQPNLIVSTAVCMAAAYVAVALRFISRSVGNVSFGKDDFFLILAIVCQCSVLNKNWAKLWQVFASAFSLIMVSRESYSCSRETCHDESLQ